MGPKVTATLERRGFYPAGGGRISVSIHPAASLAPVEILERGELRSVRATAIVSSLPAEIAKRELRIVGRKLDLDRSALHVVEDRTSPGPGNAIVLEFEGASVTEVFTGFGEKRVSAEAVAEKVCTEAREWLDSGVPVGEHLADQLLIPLALARGGSLVTGPLSRHSTTNMDVIRTFLGTTFQVDPADHGAHRVSVKP